MTARAPLSLIPYRMRVEDAAAFCGEAPSTFRAKVAAGRFPGPAWTEGGRVYWRTQDLIEAMEDRDRIATPAATQPPTKAQLREAELARRGAS